MADDTKELLDGIRAIEWNEEKVASNRRKHGIEFDEAVGALYGPVLLSRSDRNNEERWLAIGETDGRAIAIAFTWRGDTDHLCTPRTKI